MSTEIQDRQEAWDVLEEKVSLVCLESRDHLESRVYQVYRERRESLVPQEHREDQAKMAGKEHQEILASLAPEVPPGKWD